MNIAFSITISEKKYELLKEIMIEQNINSRSEAVSYCIKMCFVYLQTINEQNK